YHGDGHALAGDRQSEKRPPAGPGHTSLTGDGLNTDHVKHQMLIIDVWAYTFIIDRSSIAMLSSDKHVLVHNEKNGAEIDDD
ncbi:hypothetical protein T265_15394, partial [Opisthorchis viverrini]